MITEIDWTSVPPPYSYTARRHLMVIYACPTLNLFRWIFIYVVTI